MSEAWLPADWVADIAGLSSTRYGQWVKRRILREAGYGQCTEAHALEAAVASDLRRSIKSLGLLRIAINKLRPSLGNLPAQIPTMMDIVWDTKGKRATWVYSNHELAPAVRLGREVIVIVMSERLRMVRDEFRRQAEDRASEGAAPTLRVIHGETAQSHRRDGSTTTHIGTRRARVRAQAYAHLRTSGGVGARLTQRLK